MDDLILAEASAVDDEQGPVLVLDAPALATALADDLSTEGRTVLHRSDLLTDETEVPATADVVDTWSDPRLADVRLVLLRLPANLNALDELAENVAAHCHPDVRVVAGSRVKHMTRGMNEVLAAHFGDVRASLGVRKCRVLHAAAPRPEVREAEPTWPRTAALDEFGLSVVAYGATFAGNRLDLGTRQLLESIIDLRPTAGADRAVDLGCGSGILAATLARNGWRVTGVDTSRAAVGSTAATAAANGVEVAVRRADALADWPEGDLDVVVCNPPFHVGTAKDSAPAFRMIRTAARALRPGGELWCVYNAHLPYLPTLRRDVGPSEIVTRDRSYLVTRSVRAQ
ncbi:methyltransferase [Raineyella fluvialis]|uniref:Methyltransferase n=1 Tax=Raineyella fluvialis TaxID=2662261 RepID=A0A5Q2FDU0_9ACTN|nr:methyltransferase [Raineyella fluvialis]